MFTRMVRMLLFICAAALAGAALAQPEPSLNQVYEAAQAGRIAQAQDMMKQVLRDHPQSAKAHYVEAELLARQKLFAQAGQELATAESLAPGLPFARPSAVRALQEQLSAQTASSSATRPFGSPATNAAATSSFPWRWALVLAGIAAVLFAVMRPRRSVPNAMASGGSAQPVTPAAAGFGQPGYGQPGYGQPGVGPARPDGAAI